MTENIVKLHTTEMGAERIKRNLNLTEDPVEWCRSKIMDKNAIIGFHMELFEVPNWHLKNIR